jgi:hypothetical protein
LISTLWDLHFENYKQCKNFLSSTPSIRTIPKGQRFYVHAGDWHRYWADSDKNKFAELDNGERAPLTPDPTDETVSRFLEVQAKKKAGK